jgi:DNA-binding SARP family transcriptional activator/class 3 adenylate cyclase
MAARVARIKLCGTLEVELDGRRVDQDLPGRQGRLVFAYLATRRDRPVSRDELMDALWPSRPPADPDQTLSALLSKVRRALGTGVIEGRHALSLVLPAAASVDLEEAARAAEQADAALALSQWASAWGRAHAALRGTSGDFLAGHDTPWVEDQRREVRELHLRALECAAAAGTALGGAELATGEGYARALIAAAPLRESGYRFLMAALAARGNVAEALAVYENLRALLREELGASPGAAVQALHERLLRDGAGGPGGAPVIDPLAQARQGAGGEPVAWANAAGPPEQASEERKLITVLSAEFAGLPGLDPEFLRVMLAPLHVRVRAELEHFGGTASRFASGAVLAVFGAPTAHEDDPERAVRAGLRVLEVAREFGCASPQLEPTIRIGVATGEALVSPGTVSEGASLAQGHVVTVAVGLQRAAEAGTVVVDGITMRATRRAIEYEEPKLCLLEGEPQARPAWAARHARPEALAETAPIAFVGRQRELTLLATTCAAVAEEQLPRLVAIVGEAGIGKTRLVGELIRRMDPGTVVYRGRCLPYGEGITYWPLREIIWAAAGILLDDRGPAASAKLRRLVGRLIQDRADADRTAAALARTAGIALADSPLDRMTPESVAEEIGLAWPRLLGALAAQRPVAVVVEDLHWAEAPLVDMLERLAARVTGPLLILTTARPQVGATRPNWSTAPGMMQIGLGPLTAAQSRELVGNLLPGVSAELRDRVVVPAEGNPFFAEEIVRHMAEEASSVGKSGTGLAIPNTVRALIAARIDALPETEKRTLHDAAVVGQTFWAATLESMAGAGPVRSALRALEEKGFITASPTSVLPSQPQFSFRHALQREVAYHSIPRARRCRAHAAVGDWIDQIAGDRHAEFADLLAYHYEAAATPQDAAIAWPEPSPDRERVRKAAVQALIATGAAAQNRLAFEQAARFADRALALAETDAERLASLELRASALHAAVRSGEAFPAYLEALELAIKLHDDGTRSRLRAHAILLCVRYSGAFTTDAWKAPAVELIERGLQDVAAGTVSFESGALLLGRSAIAAWAFDGLAGREDTAEEDAWRAAQIAEAIDSPYLFAHAVEALIEHAARNGFCQAGDLAERLLSVCEKLSDRAEVHEGLVTAAISFARAGRYERARKVARRATHESARLSAHHHTHAAAAETMSLVPAGRFADLGRQTQRVPHIVRAEGHACDMGALSLAGRALALYECGDRDAAYEALDLLAGPPPLGLVPLRCLAIDFVRPLVGLERTQHMAASLESCTGTVMDRLYALRLSLQLSALAGDWATVDRLVAEAKQLAPRACAPAVAWIADWADAVRLAAAGSGNKAVGQARRAARGLQRYGEPYTAGRLLVDMLPFLDRGLRAKLAEAAAKRLNALGACASASEAAATLEQPVQ